jgi:MoxR-like ATPase
MSNRPVDYETRYSADNYEHLSEQRAIEDPEVFPVPVTNPPTRMVDREPYLPDSALVEAVNLALTLRRPLLLQGDPGCGKTRLAYAVAYTLGWPLETSYIKSTSRAQDLLYTYDVVSRLYDAQLGSEGPRDPQRPDDPKCRDPRNYIYLGPLGRAIVRAGYGRPSVVLIDEIDKADLDFPNDLLYELDRRAFGVPEVPSMHFSAGDDPRTWPLVIVTHNEEKALPTAFLRRCIFYVLQFPDNSKHLHRILAMHQIGTPELSAKAIDILQELRKIEFSKRPGLSELIDWISYHEVRGTDPQELDNLPGIAALLKQQGDQQRIRREWRDKGSHE